MVWDPDNSAKRMIEAAYRPQTAGAEAEGEAPGTQEVPGGTGVTWDEVEAARGRFREERRRRQRATRARLFNRLGAAISGEEVALGFIGIADVLRFALDLFDRPNCQDLGRSGDDQRIARELLASFTRRGLNSTHMLLLAYWMILLICEDLDYIDLDERDREPWKQIPWEEPDTGDYP